MNDAAPRLALYRSVARSLGAFYARFTSPFCANCLEVTRRHHAGDPRADVDLLEGFFPGCCHAGVGDALQVPRAGEAGRFSEPLAAALRDARAALGLAPAEPPPYRIRERATGLLARGYGCVHVGPQGCRLGELKGPLCIAYVCEPVREALAGVLGWDWVGSDGDDFCGTLAALRASVGGDLAHAEAQAKLLEERLEQGAERLARWEGSAGATLFACYSSEKESSPSCSTR